MNAVLVVMVVLLAGLAVVIAGTGVAGLVGRLPGNGVLGVRTPETRRSPEAWALANRAAGPAFLGAGLVLLLGTLALGLIGGWVGGVVVVVALLGALVLLSVAGLSGARAAAVWQAHQEPEPGGCGCGSDSGSGGGCGSHSADRSADHSPGHSADGGADAAAGEPASDPASDCGVTGGCGSCALQGMCEPEATRS